MGKTKTTSRIITKKTSVFLVLVCLWAVCLSQTHYHADADRHHDCLICAFLAHPAANHPAAVVSAGCDMPAGRACVSAPAFVITTSTFLPGPQRAPPA